MPVAVTMHACSAFPVAIDFTVFRCYLAGYSVEETVEHLMSLRENAQTPSAAPSAASHSPLSTPVAIATATTTTTAAAAEETSSKPSPRPPDVRALKHEDGRQDAEEIPLALLPAEDTVEVAKLVENASLIIASNGVNLADVKSETRDLASLVDGDRRLPREAARAPTVVPEKEGRDKGKSSSGKDKSKSKKRGKHVKGRHHNTNNLSYNTFWTGGFDDGKERKRRHSGGGGHRSTKTREYLSTSYREPKARSFFLNENYMNFQKRLQQVEGGPSSGAPLSSELLFLETKEQYRLYELFIQEEFLSCPYAFLAKHYLPIAVPDRIRLVELYYEVDMAVFRYFFGDKMQKFEPIDSSHMHAARNNGLGEGGVAASTGGNGSPYSSTNNAATAVGSLLMRWAMHGSHNEEAIAYLLHINTLSLKRQWESIRRVCTTMVNLYLAKSDMIVPRGVSLLEAIRQCYGIRGELAAAHATAVFGYHHRLTTRLFDALHDFSGYSTLCNIIAAQWCDQTLLLLDECFVDRCRRIGKLLDENRVLAELHQLMFGEVLRPRWQVQLDEVQRAITTNSGAAESTAAAAAAAAALSNMIASPNTQQLPGGGGGGDGVGSPTSTGVHGTGAVSTTDGSRPHSPQPHGPQPSASSPPFAHHGSPNGLASPAGSPLALGAAMPTAAGIHSSSAAGAATALGSVVDSGGASGAAAGGGSVAQHSALCANKQFSRRFMYEFTYMLRHLSKIALQLGVNTSINDALDTFYVRIYTYLESMSTRSAPAMANMVRSSAAVAAAAAASGNKSFAGAGAAAPTLPTSKSQACMPTAPHGGGDNTVNSPSASVRSCAARPADPPTKHLVKSSSVPVFAVDASLRGPSPLGDATSSLMHDSRSTGTSTPNPSPITTIVNTSLSHPVTSLLPLSSLVAQQQAIGGPPPVTSPIHVVSNNNNSSSSGGGNGEGRNAVFALEARASDTVPFPSTRAANLSDRSIGGQADGMAGATVSISRADSSVAVAASPSAFNPVLFGDVMLKALDKRYLRELSMFLSALPRVWRQAHTLTAEDHAACDDAFTDFIVALKAVSQIIMAAEDFH